MGRINNVRKGFFYKLGSWNLNSEVTRRYTQHLSTEIILDTRMECREIMETLDRIEIPFVWLIKVEKYFIFFKSGCENIVARIGLH